MVSYNVFCISLAQTVKCVPTMRETWVWSLVREDPLEKEMATHSSIHAWKIPWTKEPGGLQSMGLQRVGHDWMTSLHFTSRPSQEYMWREGKLRKFNFLIFLKLLDFCFTILCWSLPYITMVGWEMGRSFKREEI